MSQPNLHCTVLRDKFRRNIQADKKYLSYLILTATVSVGTETYLIFS